METDISELRRLCKAGTVRWTEHIATRLLKRGISRRQVISVIQSGVIIEQYPNDYPYPSCLISGCDESGKALHVVCGLAPDAIWMVTAYIPDPYEWADDLRTRRTSE